MHGGGETLGFSHILRGRSVFNTWKASFLYLSLHLPHTYMTRERKSMSHTFGEVIVTGHDPS